LSCSDGGTGQLHPTEAHTDTHAHVHIRIQNNNNFLVKVTNISTPPPRHQPRRRAGHRSRRTRASNSRRNLLHIIIFYCSGGHRPSASWWYSLTIPYKRYRYALSVGRLLWRRGGAARAHAHVHWSRGTSSPGSMGLCTDEPVFPLVHFTLLQCQRLLYIMYIILLRTLCRYTHTHTHTRAHARTNAQYLLTNARTP